MLAVGTERHTEHLCGWLVAASHSRSVLSSLPETMRCPSGLNATPVTASVWPVSGAPTGWPVPASYTRTVLSTLPEAMCLPSGLNATPVTASVWPVSGAPTGWPVPASHTRRRVVEAARDDASCRRG